MKPQNSEVLTQTLKALENTVSMLENFAGPPGFSSNPIDLQFFETRMAIESLRSAMGLPVTVSAEDAETEKKLRDSVYWPVTDQSLSRNQLRGHIGQMNFALTALREKVGHLERKNKNLRQSIVELNARRFTAPLFWKLLPEVADSAMTAAAHARYKFDGTFVASFIYDAMLAVAPELPAKAPPSPECRQEQPVAAPDTCGFLCDNECRRDRT